MTKILLLGLVLLGSTSCFRDDSKAVWNSKIICSCEGGIKYVQYIGLGDYIVECRRGVRILNPQHIVRATGCGLEEDIRDD